MTIDGVLIGKLIYWTVTLSSTNNYESLTELRVQKITVAKHTHYCCLVAASHSGRFPNCPRPQVPASHLSQLTQQLNC
jgi:hypothetical protein